jgi:hypothetical protein
VWAPLGSDPGRRAVDGGEGGGRWAAAGLKARLGWLGFGGPLGEECFFYLVLVVSNLNIQFKFDSTQENPNKLQINIQLITLANYKPKIIGGANIKSRSFGEETRNQP